MAPVGAFVVAAAFALTAFATALIVQRAFASAAHATVYGMLLTISCPHVSAIWWYVTFVACLQTETGWQC